MNTLKRRYDLDWLRIIAIMAVYFHHIGMPFNGDDFHIMNATSSKLLDDIMVYFEQFRLPLLFLISGIGTVFAFSKRTWRRFLKERTSRLLIPLFFGVLFIVPPQTYYQYINELSSYKEIYTTGRFEVNHLWFIENLFIISILAIPLIIFLKSKNSKKLLGWVERMIVYRMGLFLGVIPLIIFTVVLKKYYPTGSKSLTNLSETFFYTFFFVSGILFASSEIFWESLKKFRRFHLVLFVFSTLLFYSYYLMPKEVIKPYLRLSSLWDIWYVLKCLLGWCFVLMLLGYGNVYFNKPSLWLKRMNEAIYPFYILHQTVIVVFAYYIIQLDMSIITKMIMLLISSFIAIVFIYRCVVNPFRFTRLLFGMKKKPSADVPSER